MDYKVTFPSSSSRIVLARLSRFDPFLENHTWLRRNIRSSRYPSNSQNDTIIIQQLRQICYTKIQNHYLPTDQTDVLHLVNTDSLSVFKSILLKYHHQSLELNYDPDNPRTFKTICLKCNSVRSLANFVSCCGWK